MEYNDLARIESLVRNLWDAAALFCLEGKPLRYSELHRNMAAWSGQHLSESEMTRARHRLVRRKMILPGPGDNGHNVYAITEAGRVRLAQIRVLMQIAPRLDPLLDGQDPFDGQDPDHKTSESSEESTDGEQPAKEEEPADGETLSR
ncbi:winged helix-turn-helix transcriptional regulator [Actinoplanes sp. NPDC026623]|uniref:winged helix-turn-helix transcriptional regulator n=1 Tax=Actinoplanes sp. NPDC026623 TaxID=3155610 RepID=UPI0033F336CE